MRHCYIAYIIDEKRANFAACKIGFSTNPCWRFQELNSMSFNGPGCMEITHGPIDQDGPMMERYLHDRLMFFRIHHEWFYVPFEALNNARSMTEDRFGVKFRWAKIDGMEDDGEYAVNSLIEKGLEAELFVWQTEAA